MPFVEVAPPPTTATVPTGGGRAPVTDSFAATIPGAGGIPEQQANIGLENEQAKQLELADKEGAAGIAKAQAEQRGAEAKIPIATAYSSAVKAAEDDFAPKLKKASDEYDAAQARASNFKYEDHWADQSTGTKVLASISSFLGGVATGNPVSRAQEWIDRDYNHQKEQGERLLKVAEMKGADQQHLLAIQESLLKNLNAGYLGKIEAVERQIDAEAKKQGTETAFVNAAKLKQDLRTAAAQKKVDDAKALRIQVMSHKFSELKKLFPEIKTRTNRATGQHFWLDPATGIFEEFLKPVASPAPVVAPTQPPPQAVP